eukprot:9994389-Ditylum_brightwellii.AAC.1
MTRGKKVVPLAQTICQACNGITLTSKQRVRVTPYLQSNFKDWHTSQLPPFAAFCSLMTAAVEPLELPEDAPTSNK